MADDPVQQNGMVDRVGPFFDERALLTRFGISAQEISNRRADCTIIACKTQEGKYVFPAWQFQQNGNLLDGLGEVLSMLAAGIDDGWTWALWLRSEVTEQLSGKSAVEWLTAGRNQEALVHLAREDAMAWRS